MAGALAAVAFLPTAVPLIWIIIQAEEELGLARTKAAALSTHSILRNLQRPVDEDSLSADVDAIRVESEVASLQVSFDAGGPVVLGAPLESSVVQEACIRPDGDASVVQRSRQEQWAVSCVQREDVVVVASVQLEPAGPAQQVFAVVLLLGLLVGIITALGILRLLRPLSEISGALAGVGAGERGVRMAQTGLAELDELVDRLNAAARSVEDREDGILGRIEVVQEMARIVAHEIRNPLQSLELLTSLIASEDDDAERREIASSIHAEIRTLEQVVHRLLRESAARGSLRLRITSQPVAPLVEQVIALRRPQANSRSVRLTLGPLSWAPLPFDAALLKRSIENLVLNALQAVPEHIGEVRMSVLEEPQWVVIVVDDNGPGIPEELRDQVFDPDFTTKAEGTGLGLALVKGVVEAHNGYIRYGSSPLGGARFEARIPLEQVDLSQGGDPL
ncbi:MAG: HAMP domain-containing histidine kinase [Myxococcales bacterium]|nr:HAMP domain-containing histidine kinase [Myxococcales bacterium]